MTTEKFASQYGEPSERAKGKVVSYLSPFVQQFIEKTPFLIMATSNANGRCDASPKGGAPGFVKIIDDTRILIPDVAGNKLFQSYNNLDENPNVGLSFFIPGVNETVRVNGSAQFVTKKDMDEQGMALNLYETDDKSIYLQGLLVTVEESYAHCPRALTFSHLWDTDIISMNSEHRPVPSKGMYDATRGSIITKENK